MRVLIAEDHDISRKILSLFLKPHGETVGVGDGQAVMEAYDAAIAAGNPFDLILLDMKMPHLGGLEALDLIRQRERAAGSEKQVPIIILTGEGELSQINQAKVLGISDYMIKPIEEKKLIRELQRLRLVPDPEDQWG